MMTNWVIWPFSVFFRLKTTELKILDRLINSEYSRQLKPWSLFLLHVSQVQLHSQSLQIELGRHDVRLFILLRLQQGSSWITSHTHTHTHTIIQHLPQSVSNSVDISTPARSPTFNSFQGKTKVTVTKCSRLWNHVTVVTVCVLLHDASLSKYMQTNDTFFRFPFLDKKQKLWACTMPNSKLAACMYERGGGSSSLPASQLRRDILLLSSVCSHWIIHKGEEDTVRLLGHYHRNEKKRRLL